MNEHQRTTDDELTQRIARALRSRESAQPDAFVVAARIEAQLATQGDSSSNVSVLSRRGGRVVIAGVVTSALAVAGAGAAAATAVANPYSEVARVVENVVQSVGVEWSAMPDGYTREQYEAFWGGEHTDEDVLRLSALWHTDATATKARAGQMILDGVPLPTGPAGGTGTAPVPPPSAEPTDAQRDAFWGAGYTAADADLLSDMWGVEWGEMKATAGQMILDGERLPIAPGDGGAPEADRSAALREAFVNAGYAWEDAESLATIWTLSAEESKMQAGQMILDGKTLPIEPGQTAPGRG